MGYQKFKELEFVYEYDTAVDAVAVGSVAMRPVGNALESGLIITDIVGYIETAFDEASGTATVTVGNAGDTDGYFTDLRAEAAGTAIKAGDRAGALVWDDTNDHAIAYKLDSSANAVPRLQIGTAALTAGKMTLVFKAYRAA